MIREKRSEGLARRRARRGPLPVHLPRIEVTLAPEDTNCPCCRAPMVEIGEDTSERLDVMPVKYQVIVTHRPKFACRSCVGTVVQMPAPPRLIEGGIPTERWSPTCWWRAMLIICRRIARRRCLPAKAC